MRKRGFLLHLEAVCSFDAVLGTDLQPAEKYMIIRNFRTLANEEIHAIIINIDARLPDELSKNETAVRVLTFITCKPFSESCIYIIIN